MKKVTEEEFNDFYQQLDNLISDQIVTMFNNASVMKQQPHKEHLAKYHVQYLKHRDSSNYLIGIECYCHESINMWVYVCDSKLAQYKLSFVLDDINSLPPFFSKLCFI